MPRALLSVYDKTGLIELAQGLLACGWTLLASGSTAKTLREQQLPVMEVSDYTQSPEMLGGRVKTLHPAIHGGLLARDTAEDHAELVARDWDYIDLVAVNLYPFAETIATPHTTLAAAVEQIDIGGVALIRAAAKNFQRVTLVCDPEDYASVLTAIQQEQLDESSRRKLAVKGFALTTAYDQVIAQYLAKDQPLAKTPSIQLTLYPQQSLRYGENPHQKATLYSFTPNVGPLGGTLLQGKALSYNNLLDLDAAWRTVVSFTKPTICIVKHLSPCGIASAEQLTDAFHAARAADPISAFGGIIASNVPFDETTALALAELFVEGIVAPGFTPAARTVLAQRANCRLLSIPNFILEPLQEWRSINQGLLSQDVDQGEFAAASWRVVTQRQPTAAEWTALRFAWLACQPVRSNAIVLVQGEATVGIGGGQPNRIDCVRIAAERAGAAVNGAVLASDAFFPFADCVELAAKLGIKAIIQPGGSLRDADSVAAADAANLTMVMTGTRHFRH